LCIEQGEAANERSRSSPRRPPRSRARRKKLSKKSASWPKLKKLSNAGDKERSDE
jgi:hypothetical protein